MDGPSKTIEVYALLDGKQPFTKWLTDLKDVKARAQILTRLNRIRLGNLGDSKFIKEGVYELRIHLNAGYRVYFGQKGNILILILCAGTKDSQERDIERAVAYWRDYESRV